MKKFAVCFAAFALMLVPMFAFGQGIRYARPNSRPTYAKPVPTHNNHYVPVPAQPHHFSGHHGYGQPYGRHHGHGPVYQPYIVRPTPYILIGPPAVYYPPIGSGVHLTIGGHRGTFHLDTRF